jgi:ankyrin repeat protein
MGKSMIASFLVEQFQKKLGNTPNMILAYHFCDNKNNKTNTATAILRGLLVQIFQQCPEMFRHIQRHFDLKGPDLFDDFEHLWQITLAILKDYKQGEIYLLVDALDECDEDSRNRFLKSIRRMPQQDVNVRTLITCRPEDDIEEIFRDSPNSLYIKLEDINSDLARYMDVRVRELVERKQWTEKEERMIKDALLANAKGIFLWAAFVLKDIEDIKRVYHIPTKLQNLPKDLTEIYERMVNGVKEEDRKVTDMVLKIVVAARRPLKKVELSMAYLMAMDSPDIWDEGIQPPNERLEQHKNEYQCCGLLLQVDEDNDTVNLVHQSAKDYLVDLYLADKDNNGNRIPARLNNVLLEICFRYMALGDLNFLARRMVFETEWDVDWEPKWWELEQDFVFLSYIGKEWEAHAIAAEHDDQRKLSRIPTLLEFRQHTLNSWLRRTTNAYPTNEPAHISELKGQERSKEVRSWEEAKKRALTITKWLISVGASLSAGDFRGLTPLHIAAREGHVDLIPLFIDSGADVNAAPPDLDGRTPLQIAAQKGHLHVIELLLQIGANIDAPAAAIRGRTALQAAAENAQVEAVELLLESGADPNSPAAGFQGVTALLAGTGGSGEYQLGTATHRIIKPRNGPAEGDAAVAQIAREDEEEAQQKALLEKKHEQIVALLLDHDAKTDTADPFGWTPLHAAAERGSLDMTKRLLAKGARINAEARHLGTPLRAAIAKQNFDVADFLETKGAIDKRQKSKIDPDSMMKYIRAVVSRILINSNSQRYYYIQSYIPIYHIIHTYCNEPTDMSMPYDPSSGAGLRGEWMYRSLETLLLDYMERMSPYLAKIRQEDFLMCYIREWTLFNRCAYYMNRMMRYLNRHWIKREMDEGKLGVYPVWELFGVRWRTGLQADVRSKINQAWVTMGETEQGGGGADPRIKTALYESLGSNNTNKDFVLVVG